MMYISNLVAQSIVEEIGNEINEHINLMDHQGKIIASTDESRIGDLHEGARRIITEKLPELYITQEKEATRKGINLPLIVSGEIVGVVGITGEQENVARYGNIVRKITEIMIEDSIRRDAKRYDNRMKNRFIEEWFQNSQLPYHSQFIKRGQNLQIDITRPYRVVIFHFEDYQTLLDTREGQKLLEEMETAVRHQVENDSGIYLREPNRQCCLYASGDIKLLKEKVERVIRLVNSKYKREIVAGIDGSNGDKMNIFQARIEAEKAVMMAVLSKKNVICYDDLDIELFLHEISPKTMQEYVDKIMSCIPKEKWEEYIRIVENYFKYDGSLAKMSEALFLHKNTLQYKLKKLAEYTGKDIRKLSNAPSYYMALMFYQNLNSEE
ncbi:helix-turn-helix domain-containing protein [Lachnospiraceae bacterium OttesenSCG-928-J05]|nr:helix-turn-helix domain-containing protein [Lachnospiraceae bacterium OttesenSCG-928-J05]